MFGGHRGTSFDNTMLNIGYFNTAASAVADRWGVAPDRLHHTGDDIWVTNHNVVVDWVTRQITGGMNESQAITTSDCENVNKKDRSYRWENVLGHVQRSQSWLPYQCKKYCG